MRLTDGKTTCKALEYHAMPELDIAALAPGCKVCVRNAIARNGLLLLDTKCFQVQPPFNMHVINEHLAIKPWQ